MTLDASFLAVAVGLALVALVIALVGVAGVLASSVSGPPRFSSRRSSPHSCLRCGPRAWT